MPKVRYNNETQIFGPTDINSIAASPPNPRDQDQMAGEEENIRMKEIIQRLSARWYGVHVLLG